MALRLHWSREALMDKCRQDQSEEEGDPSSGQEGG